jgi:hypothetical protein
MADFVVTLSGPVTGTGAGAGFQVYTASVLNNGLNGTGTNLLAYNATATMTSAGVFHMDTTFDLDQDGANDVNITGDSQFYKGPTSTPPTTDPYASATKAYTFSRVASPTFVLAAANGVQANSTAPDFLSKNYNSGVAFNPVWTSLTSFTVAEGSALTGGGSADNTTAIKFFNIAVPTGATFTLSGYAGGTSGPQSQFTISNSSGPTPTYPIIVLKTSAGSNTGGAITPGNAGTTANPQGTFVPSGTSLTVTGGGGSYMAGFIYNLTAGTTAGNVQTAGFTGTDTNIYLLNIKVAGSDPTLAQENTIIADINNVAAGNTGVVASLVAANLTSLGGVVSAWDIELTLANPAAQNGVFGFNFAGETNVSGVTVTDIAAVPEPATAGLLLVGGLGLLARRRRSAN